MKNDIDLINLAKNGKTTKPVVNKPISNKTTIKNKKNIVKKIEDTKISAEEERNLKAKQTIEKLLEDSPIITLGNEINNKPKDNLNNQSDSDLNNQSDSDLNNQSDSDLIPTNSKNIDWLEEQVSTLTNELDLLRNEYVMLLEKQQNMLNGYDEKIKNSVIVLFNELQQNHISLGVDPNTGIGNFRIYCPGFLNRMIKFFPFLEEIKQF